MANILIIGAGSMGTAFSFPCSDNGHSVTIIGTHLENNFIEQINLKRTAKMAVIGGFTNGFCLTLWYRQIDRTFRHQNYMP